MADPLCSPFTPDQAKVLATLVDAHQSGRRMPLASNERRAAMLDSIASSLARVHQTIVDVCSAETSLTPDELAPEFDRMVGTLRMFAALVREGSWVRAAIDTRRGTTQAGPPLVGPDHDVRSMLIPLDGIVAVFGASNFPLAYGVCGGDTASALAAGCPVIVKEHPAHPKTGRLLASIVREAVGEGIVGYLENTDPADTAPAEALVMHDAVAAVGFTGSLKGGMALTRLAASRPRPIPVFAEMGSVNRVVICPTALARRSPMIAAELAASILARHGQQCTKPGIISLDFDDAAGPAFVAELARLLDAAPARRMLSERVTEQYLLGCRRLSQVPMARVTKRGLEETVDGRLFTRPALFAAMDKGNDLDSIHTLTPDGRGFWLNDEVFGPAAIVLGSGGWENLYYADAALVTTVYAEPEDLESMIERDDSPNAPAVHTSGLESAIRSTGRITFNSVPTGVRVAGGMVHGGPFPATNRPESTAVGPRAIERWCRPVCFQNCPDQLLPPALQDANPLRMTRLLNGVVSREAAPRV